MRCPLGESRRSASPPVPSCQALPVSGRGACSRAYRNQSCREVRPTQFFSVITDEIEHVALLQTPRFFSPSGSSAPRRTCRPSEPLDKITAMPAISGRSEWWSTRWPRAPTPFRPSRAFPCCSTISAPVRSPGWIRTSKTSGRGTGASEGVHSSRRTGSWARGSSTGLVQEDRFLGPVLGPGSWGPRRHDCTTVGRIGAVFSLLSPSTLLGFSQILAGAVHLHRAVAGAGSESPTGRR